MNSVAWNLLREFQLRQSPRLHHLAKHGREAVGVLDLVLHVIEAREHREVGVRIRIHHRGAVFEVVFRAVGELTAESGICQGFSLRNRLEFVSRQGAGGWTFRI